MKFNLGPGLELQGSSDAFCGKPTGFLVPFWVPHVEVSTTILLVSFEERLFRYIYVT